nr:PREDICTED: uncharacterized protein LOC107078981 isoform X1 [Lepisosteus oculatus]
MPEDRSSSTGSSYETSTTTTELPSQDSAESSTRTSTAALEETSTATTTTLLETSTTTEGRSLGKDIAALDWCYLSLALVGLIASGFILYSYLKSYRTGCTFRKLDILVGALSISDSFIILYSIPTILLPYSKITNPSCAVFSFFFNFAYLNAQFLHVLVGCFLKWEESRARVALVRKAVGHPAVCVALSALAAFLCSVLITGLLGTHEGIHQNIACQLDPPEASPQYDIAKFSLGFLLPYLLLMGFLITCCVVWIRDKVSFPSRLKACSGILAVGLTAFCSRLVYNSILVHRSGLKSDTGEGSLWKQALTHSAELVLFSACCLELVLLVFLCQPCQDARRDVVRHLQHCCQSISRREANRNIMEPHIEIGKDDPISLNSDNQES